MWLPSPTHTRLGETWEGRAHVTDEGILHLDPQTLGVGSQVIDAVTHTLFPRVLRVGQQQQPKVLRREVHFRTQPHLHVLGRLGAGTVLLKNVVRFLLDLAHSRQDFHGQDVTGGEPHRQRATPADNDGRSNNAKHYHDSFGRGHEADFTDVLVVADHNFTLLVDDWIDRESIFIRKKMRIQLSWYFKSLRRQQQRSRRFCRLLSVSSKLLSMHIKFLLSSLTALDIVAAGMFFCECSNFEVRISFDGLSHSKTVDKLEVCLIQIVIGGLSRSWVPPQLRGQPSDRRWATWRCWTYGPRAQIWIFHLDTHEYDIKDVLMIHIAWIYSFSPVHIHRVTGVSQPKSCIDIIL